MCDMTDDEGWDAADEYRDQQDERLRELMDNADGCPNDD